MHVINELLAELQRQRAEGDEARRRLRDALAVHEDQYRLALPPHVDDPIGVKALQPKLEV